MYKNILIIILLFLLGSLLIDNNKNVDLIMENVTSIKEKITDTFNYATSGVERSGIKEETFFEDPKTL